MPGLIFLIYMLSLISGSATLGIGISLYFKYQKVALKHFLWFLSSLFLILLSFIFSHYGYFTYSSTGIDFSLLSAIFQKIGALCFISTAWFFYFSLAGITPGKFRFILQGSLTIFCLLLFLIDLFLGGNTIINFILMLIFLLNILLGFFIIGFNFKQLASASLKKALLIFLLITFLFLPLLILDMSLHRLDTAHWLQRFDNISQPFYFLILNICCIYFVIKYLSQPSLYKAGQITEYFISYYRITEREAQIITKLLSGLSSKEIGEAMFISPKTVDNHIYNIFQKLNIKNRIQLVQMINSNSE